MTAQADGMVIYAERVNDEHVEKSMAVGDVKKWTLKISRLLNGQERNDHKDEISDDIELKYSLMWVFIG